MDHKSFVSSLSAQEKASLTQRSDRVGLLHLLGHLGVLALGAIWIGFGWLGWQAVLVPYGIALVFLFTLEHECTHKTPFADARLNEWVGRLCGVLLLLPFEWFRYFHLAHHRWTNIPGKDPEIEEPRPETWKDFAKYLSGFPYWIALAKQLWINARGVAHADYLPANAHPRIRREARWMLGVYAGLALSLLWSPLVLWIWVIPAVLGQPFLRLYLLAEHGRCPPVANMFENTRTTFTNSIVRFLAWNMPYHAEHHIFPNVPFYKLPQLHKATKEHLQVTSDGYRTFAGEYTQDLRS